MKLLEVPDEVMVIIFTQVTGYQYQQRLVRTCRKFRNLVSSRLDHIWTDIPTAENGLYFAEFSRAATQTSPPWKYRCSAVRQVTFDGRFKVDFGADCGLNPTWLRRFPNYERLNFVNFTIPLFIKRSLPTWFDLERPVPITIDNAFIDAFPHSFRDRYPHPLDCKLFCILNGGDITYYSRCPRLIFLSGNDVLAVLDSWVDMAHFSAETVTMVSKYAADLDPKEVTRMFRCPSEVSQAYNRTLPGYVPKKNQLCPQHQRLCRHLPPLFYRENFDGQVLNMLKLMILRQTLPTSKEPGSREELYEFRRRYHGRPSFFCEHNDHEWEYDLRPRRIEGVW